MSDTMEREYQAQVLKLCVANQVNYPECVVFDFFRGGKRATHPIGIGLKHFGLGGSGRQTRHDVRRGPRLVDADGAIELVFDDFFERLEREADTSRPLWIELCHPRGELVLVPWERFFAGRVPMPILRWPNHALLPNGGRRDTDTGLEIALCASVPRAKSSFSVERWIDTYAGGILSLGRPHRLHVFVDYDTERRDLQDDWSSGDVATFERLGAELAEPIESGRLILYDPREAASYGVAARVRGIPSADGIANPWLRWIQDSVDVALDLVHFCCHGYLAGGRGSLAFAESPIVNRDRHWSRFVGAGELVELLDGVGAWAVGFSSPHHNYSEAALFSLANEILDLRPIALLIQDSRRDPGCADQIECFRFLCQNEPQCLPKTAALTVFGHPGLLQEAHYPRAASYEAVLTRSGLSVEAEDLLREVSKRTQEIGETRPDERWVAASQRYVERKVSDLLDADLESEPMRGEIKSPPALSLSAGKKTQAGRERALEFVARVLAEAKASDG